MSELLSNMDKNVLLLIVLLLAGEIARFAGKQYYSRTASQHILNTKYHFASKSDESVRRVNVYCFALSMIGLIVGGVGMYFNVYIGICLYLVIAKVGCYLLAIAMGKGIVEV